MQRHLFKLVAVVLWLVVGCGVGEVEPAAQPNLLVLGDDEAAAVTVAPLAIYIETDDARDLASVQPGDVLASNGAQPFLRKVLSTSVNGSVLAIVTEPAVLTDAILDGSMSSTRDLFAEASDADGLVVGVDQLALDFENTTLIDQGDIKVNVDRGTIRFRPTLDVDVAIEGGELSQFHAILRGELSASMGVTITAGRSFSKSFSKTIWQSPPYRITQLVGAVPVIETIRVSLVLSGDVHAGGNGTIQLGSASANAGLEAGATYDGKWRVLADPAIDLAASGPTYTGSITGGASLRLSTRVDIKFYEVAGPHLEIGAYARTDVNPVADGPTWNARVGLDGNFGGNVSVLGKQLTSINKQMFDVGKSFSAF